MEENKNKKFKVGMLIVLTAFITFVLTILGVFICFSNGKQIGRYVLVTKTEENEAIANELDKFRLIIDKYFYGEINEEKLKEGAISGYIEGLDDPYTEYISKEKMKDYLEDTKGNFVGVGIYMSKDTAKNRILIIGIIPDSPAERAGIKAGDYIKTVDGKEYTAEDFDRISSKVKGEEGTTVKLELIRDEQIVSFELKREKVVVNKVEGKTLENNIGYIKIASFDESTANDFKEKFEELQKQNIKSLIIDLRNNGGGIVNEATKIADYILDKDSVILYEIDKNQKETSKKSEHDPIINMPIVVLINGNTASSSEILAGALKDLRKSKNSWNYFLWKRGNSRNTFTSRWKWFKNYNRAIPNTK